MKILRYTLLFITISLTAATALARPQKNDNKTTNEKPDMAEIQRQVNNPSSPYFYPNLMRQYAKADTSMTLDQYRHLYLGYVFQEDYNPYRRSIYSPKIEELYFRETHSMAECDTIIQYAELALKDDPFDLRQMSFLIYAYREKGKNNLANIWQYKLNHLLEAILSTGTGLDEENAWIVINPQHEYNLLNFNGLVVESQEDRGNYDYITVSPKTPKDEHKSYYFDVTYVLREYNRKFPDADDPLP